MTTPINSDRSTVTLPRELAEAILAHMEADFFQIESEWGVSTDRDYGNPDSVDVIRRLRQILGGKEAR